MTPRARTLLVSNFTGQLLTMWAVAERRMDLAWLLGLGMLVLFLLFALEAFVLEPGREWKRQMDDWPTASLPRGGGYTPRPTPGPRGEPRPPRGGTALTVVQPRRPDGAA